MPLDVCDRWLNRGSEQLYNNGVPSRQPQSSGAFEQFVAVLQRSHPLLPPEFDGPADAFVARVSALLEKADPKSYLYEHKCKMALTTADYIGGLPIFHATPADEYTRQVLGLQFFTRPQQPIPFEVPISQTRRTLRPEAVEAFWILTVLLRSLGLFPTPRPAPEGNAPYIPYYGCSSDAERTQIPKRTRATDLARVAFFFRQAAPLPSDKQPLTLHSFTAAAIAPPISDEAKVLSKEYYRQRARVQETFAAREQTPLESGISYFNAKLLELRDAMLAVFVSVMKPCHLLTLLFAARR